MRITFVHIADQVHYEPGTAQLAGLLKNRSWMPWNVLTDYNTSRDVFVAAVRDGDPGAVAFRVTHQTREIVGYFAGLVMEQPETIPVFLYGPLCQSHPQEVVGIAEQCIILTGDPEVGLEAITDSWPEGPLPASPPPGCWYVHGGEVHKGEDGGPADINAIPKPDLTVFGGDRIFRRGIGASLFGDTKVLPLSVCMGSPSGLPANDKLLNFCHPTLHEPRLLDIDKILFRLRALGPRVRHFEIWDREFGFDVEYSARLLDKIQKRQRKKTYSIRVLAQTFDESVLDIPGSRHLRRVVTELDAGSSELHGKLPETQDPNRVEHVIRCTRDRGFAPGLIVSVGLPHETLQNIEDKLDFIRGSGVDAARFVPFEPRYGSPLYSLCSKEGMFDDRTPSWNREVWQPLRQDCLTSEEWHVAWQKCLDLQAELQLQTKIDFTPTPAS